MIFGLFLGLKGLKFNRRCRTNLIHLVKKNHFRPLYTSKGQITIPAEVRKNLGLQEGSHVAFIETENGYMMVNSSMLYLRQAQKEFTGMAAVADVKNEYDVAKMVKEMRGK